MHKPLFSIFPGVIAILLPGWLLLALIVVADSGAMVTIRADGEYRYETFVTTGSKEENEAEDTTQLNWDDGRFMINDSVLSPWQVTSTAIEQPLSFDIFQSQNNWLRHLVYKLLTWIFPSAQAADVIVSDDTPTLFFDDTDTVDLDWRIFADQNAISMFNYDTTRIVFFADDATPYFLHLMDTHYGIYNANHANYSLYLDDTSGVDVLYANSVGDIELADGSVFIDKSANHLGIGTITPQHGLHIADTAPTLLLEDTDGSVDWTLNHNVLSSTFDIAHTISSSTVSPFIINSPAPADSFYLDGSGSVGLGTSSPLAPLHLKRSVGTAQLMVEEASGTNTKRQLFRLINNGVIRFSMENTGNGNIWDFITNNSGFGITLVGTGGTEFIVNNDGSVKIGPGGVANFYVASNGNLTIGGVLTENSDIHAKENIIPVKADEVLTRLSVLPISRWNYKDDAVDHRHLGPMAQDFYEVFGLGEDDKHIATLDMAGVALAGIKALHAQGKEKDKQIRQLQQDNANNREYIEQLKLSNEERISQLQTQLRQMQSTLLEFFSKNN